MPLLPASAGHAGCAAAQVTAGHLLKEAAGGGHARTVRPGRDTGLLPTARRRSRGSHRGSSNGSFGAGKPVLHGSKRVGAACRRALSTSSAVTRPAGRGPAAFHQVSVHEKHRRIRIAAAEQGGLGRTVAPVAQIIVLQRLAQRMLRRTGAAGGDAGNGTVRMGDRIQQVVQAVRVADRVGAAESTRQRVAGWRGDGVQQSRRPGWLASAVGRVDENKANCGSRPCWDTVDRGRARQQPFNAAGVTRLIELVTVRVNAVGFLVNWPAYWQTAAPEYLHCREHRITNAAMAYGPKRCGCGNQVPAAAKQALRGHRDMPATGIASDEQLAVFSLHPRSGRKLADPHCHPGPGSSHRACLETAASPPDRG